MTDKVWLEWKCVTDSGPPDYELIDLDDMDSDFFPDGENYPVTLGGFNSMIDRFLANEIMSRYSGYWGSTDTEWAILSRPPKKFLIKELRYAIGQLTQAEVRVEEAKRLLALHYPEITQGD